MVVLSSLFLWWLACVTSQTTFARIAWRGYHRPDIALFLDRNDATLAMEIGNYYFNGGAYDIEKAKRAFERAREIDPKLVGTRFQLSRIEFLRSHFETALALANEEFAIHPEFDRVYYLRGLIYGYADDLPRAAEDFQQFLKTHEHSWAGHNDLAWIYFRQGKFEKVAEIAKRGLELNPGNAWLLATYGTALLNINKKDEARRVLSEALANIEKLTLENWGDAYPGNNPKIYAQGLDEMKKTIKKNLDLASK